MALQLASVGTTHWNGEGGSQDEFILKEEVRLAVFLDYTKSNWMRCMIIVVYEYVWQQNVLSLDLTWAKHGNRSLSWAGLLGTFNHHVPIILGYLPMRSSDVRD